MDSVDKVNKLSKSDFISIFGNVFEKTTWIAEKVFPFKPFENFDELTERFLNIFENEKKETIGVFRHKNRSGQFESAQIACRQRAITS